MADPNTRQGKRTPVTLKIKFKSETIEQFIERYAVDVSQGGIFIRTKEPLAVGTQMRFEFQLRDASPLIAGEGTVVWTRENDPSRPAIAPGMGVRFDRLADGSQSVLERILSEKAKQAPHRGDGPTKPPMFTDTPTRVAPAPVQEALLGNEPRRTTRDFLQDKTPLPKSQPFHSDADEFPDEAFEEATKVRALDDLIAQTADDSGGSGGDLFSGKPPDELAARRAGLRADSTLADPPAPQQDVDPSSTSPGFASGRGSQPGMPERDSAPGLPSPPEHSAPAKQPRMLDTTPSPRTDAGSGANDAAAAAKEALIAQNARMEKLAKTKIGMEPAHVSIRPTMPTPAPMPVVARDAPTRPSGIPVDTSRPAAKRSKAPLIILLLLLVAAGGGALWFFVLRDKLAEDAGGKVAGSDKTGSDKTGSNNTGSDKPGSQVAIGSDKPGSDVGSAKPAGPMVDIEISAPFPKANIEIVDTDLKGPAPFKTKLEKDKVYKVRVTAPGYAISETDVKGGVDKWVAKLDPKPYVVTVSSEPAGALILIDGQPIGHSTPFDVELTKVQVARKNVRVSLRKVGFRPIDKMVDTSAFTEDPAKMMSHVDERLAVQVQIIQRPPPPVGSGSGSAGSAKDPTGGSATPPTGSDTQPNPGSATPPTGGGTGGGGTAGGGGGSAKEPEPDFVKKNTP